MRRILPGLARLPERGHFAVPDGVQSATREFQHGNDKPALFVDECCVTGADCRIQSSLLYRAYKAWCNDNGHMAQSATVMAEEWRRLGFERYRAGGASHWRGVGLRADAA